MTLTCRELKIGDGQAWQRVFASVAAEGKWIGAETPVSDWSQKIVEQYANQSDRVLFLAELDSAPVGWITVETQSGGAAELGMGVLSNYRRRGIGTAMMEAAVKWATSKSIERLRLEVFPHNEPAISMYRKFGFAEIDRRVEAWERRNGERWDLIVMELTLPAR